MRPSFRSNQPTRPLWGLAATGAAGFVALALAVAPLAAQNTITGTVVDGGTQRPLGGAQVQVEGTNLGVLTDNRGRFLILNVPTATVTVRVVMIGYREATASAASGQA
ncbi:MAG: carboxypeptidase-like regulatory domain-containing protein, partial [Gemmatimonadetes bacterium]|nr:carboxypeptidase-like regulatory domain-containing protein [Gemmatimonadota bacterium]